MSSRSIRGASTPAAAGGGDPAAELFATVVAGDHCVGCGICASVEDAPIRMRLDDDGQYRPFLHDPSAVRSPLPSICPFGASGPDEDDIAAELFASAPHRRDIGHHLATYAGHVVEGSFRERGSSGGMATWLLSELLATGRVDHVIHVEEAQAGNEPLFTYRVRSTVDGVARASRAAYYPVEMSEVLAHVRDHPGRYAITGVPCFVKGLRRLALVDDLVRDRIAFTVGIICGHLKTTGYAESLAWQLGVPPHDLGGIDFRTKIVGRTAREKGVTAFDRQGRASESRVVQQLVGTRYPHGFFKLSACDFCDDVVAETADVAVGDAWLPEYVMDGNSVVVVRSPEIHAMIEAARATGRLQLDAISPQRAAASQAGGLRDRRQGLAYRLHVADRERRWRPPKRVEPSTAIPAPLKLTYRLRMTIPRRSVEAFARAKAAGDLDGFLREMQRWIRLYDLSVRGVRLRDRVVDRLVRLGIRER